MSVEKLVSFLKEQGITLVLADVGASGDVWGGFEKLLPVADLVRFDPDLRAMQAVESSEGRKRITINKAVTDIPSPEVSFYLTKFPYCSSVLLPDFDRIRDYDYEDLFELVGEIQLPATTIEQALKNVGLERIDWIKLDTQGTEFRILRSLPQELLDRLLVCDVEASLYAHYVGADTLPDIHRLMLAGEFWVAGMTPHLRTRGRKKTLATIEASQPAGFRRSVYQNSIHRGPTSLEFTYARTVRGSRKIGLDREGLIRLFACHYALGAFEYCIEILEEFSSDGLSRSDATVLGQIAMEAIEDRMRKRTMPFILDRLHAKIETLLRKVSS